MCLLGMAQVHNHLFDEDGIDRRGFLSCMAWAGTGVLFSMHGGILSSQPLAKLLTPEGQIQAATASFNFVQISDSHIGFSKDANKDVIGTLQAAVNAINKAAKPDLLLHTGDLSHLSKADEFDALDRILMQVKTDRFFVPGEHDVLEDDGKLYLERYGKGSKGHGWYSFDHKGVHFVALVNVFDLKAGGLGNLGDAQLNWLADDLKRYGSSTPVVVFAHVPLWTIYPDWGWGTADAARALDLLKRFGSVTVLNGHIHQTMQKVEGNVTFHTAMSTAFPQPKPGAAPSPGPMKVPAEELTKLLGITSVGFVSGQASLAIVDSTLANLASTGDAQAVSIDNFNFNPTSLAVPIGTAVRWTNKDDIPHNVMDVNGRFKSKTLDTDDSFEFRFTQPGTYDYICTIHPHMQGKVVVH